MEQNYNKFKSLLNKYLIEKGLYSLNPYTAEYSGAKYHAATISVGAPRQLSAKFFSNLQMELFTSVVIFCNTPIVIHLS